MRDVSFTFLVIFAAKSLQSCLTLCDLTDGSPPGSAVPQLPVSLFMFCYILPFVFGFSRQEHWSGLPFPSPMHESGK